MKIEAHLKEFYQNNQIPDKGGSEDKTFIMTFGPLKITLPNPKFRRDVTHIHDIHHLLNACDTQWKGEAYIAGWEISTGILKYFPVGLLSLWAMGYSLWLYPKTVYQGFVKGASQHDLLGLRLSKEHLMDMELEQLKIKLSKSSHPSRFRTITSFIFLLLISQIFFLFPLIFLIILFFLLG